MTEKFSLDEAKSRLAEEKKKNASLRKARQDKQKKSVLIASKTPTASLLDAKFSSLNEKTKEYLEASMVNAERTNQAELLQNLKQNPFPVVRELLEKRKMDLENATTKELKKIVEKAVQELRDILSDLKNNGYGPEQTKEPAPAQIAEEAIPQEMLVPIQELTGDSTPAENVLIENNIPIKHQTNNKEAVFKNLRAQDEEEEKAKQTRTKEKPEEVIMPLTDILESPEERKKKAITNLEQLIDRLQKRIEERQLEREENERKIQEIEKVLKEKEEETPENNLDIDVEKELYELYSKRSKLGSAIQQIKNEIAEISALGNLFGKRRRLEKELGRLIGDKKHLDQQILELEERKNRP